MEEFTVAFTFTILVGYLVLGRRYPIQAIGFIPTGVALALFLYSTTLPNEIIPPMERSMPPRKSTMVNGRHTLFLEDLDVQPGDFVSYYVRARDLTRGTRPNEARSDIFFLEVKPYEQEFALAQS